MNQFYTLKNSIIDAAKARSPSWAHFEYRKDFTQFDESFVFDSVSALKSMRIKGLEVENNTDSYFRVRFLPVD